MKLFNRKHTGNPYQIVALISLVSVGSEMLSARPIDSASLGKQNKQEVKQP